MKIVMIDSQEKFNEVWEDFKQGAMIKDSMFLIGIEYKYNFLYISSKTISLVIDLIKINCLPDSVKIILISRHWFKCGIGIDVTVKLLTHIYGLPVWCSVYDMELFHRIRKNNTKQSLKFLLKKYDIDPTIENSIAFEKLGRVLILGEENINEKHDIESIDRESSDEDSHIVNRDPISFLNEYSQKYKIPAPEYSITNDDEKFICECKFMGKTSLGYGINKRSSKINSAKKIKKELGL